MDNNKTSSLNTVSSLGSVTHDHINTAHLLKENNKKPAVEFRHSNKSTHKKSAAPSRSNGVARVSLCIDISGSMGELFKKGLIESLARQAVKTSMELDDGTVDLFLFGKKAHFYGAIRKDDLSNISKKIRKSYRLELGTDYSCAFEMVNERYKFASDKSDMPAVVLFATNGDTDNHRKALDQLKNSGASKLHWQFMCFGYHEEHKSKKFGLITKTDYVTDFGFLTALNQSKLKGLPSFQFMPTTLEKLNRVGYMLRELGYKKPISGS